MFFVVVVKAHNLVKRACFIKSYHFCKQHKVTYSASEKRARVILVDELGSVSSKPAPTESITWGSVRIHRMIIEIA